MKIFFLKHSVYATIVAALFQAAIFGQVDAVKQPSKETVSKSETVDKRLFYAVGSGELTLVKKLLKQGLSVNRKDEKTLTPLHVAADSKEDGSQMILLLLKAGANINARTDYGSTPLIMSLQVYVHSNNAKILLENGADVHLTNEYNGYTPLHSAAEGRFEIVKMLLERGANPNPVGKDGNTPLMSAVSGRHLEIVDLLIASGADVNLRNNKGKTALQIAEDELKRIQEREISLGKGVNFEKAKQKRSEIINALKKANAI